MTIQRALTIVGLAAAVAIVGCDSDDHLTVPVANDLVTFHATMTFAAEVPTPPVASTGSGSFTAVLDTVTGQFVYDFTFTGLTSNTTNGHIHGPAGTTAAAGTTINFATLPGANFTLGATSGVGHGSTFLVTGTAITATINGDSLKKLMLSGQTYVNIHTVNNPNGEIRGQIIR